MGWYFFVLFYFHLIQNFVGMVPSVYIKQYITFKTCKTKTIILWTVCLNMHIIIIIHCHIHIIQWSALVYNLCI